MSHDLVDLADQPAAMARLEEERRCRGMTLGDMEEKSGVSTNSFYAWKTGARAPQLPLLVALAQTLGFEVYMRPAQPGTGLATPRRKPQNRPQSDARK